MGFPAVARRFLPAGAAAEERARPCQPAGHRDRDQRHLLRRAKAGELSPLARGNARRFRLLAEGAALCDHRSDLATAGPSIERFFASGVLELRDKLGPILWQFAPRTPFDKDNFAAFLELLPRSLDSRAIRHVLEVRHPSFVSPEFTELLRRHAVAAALVDDDNYPSLETDRGLRLCSPAALPGERAHRLFHRRDHGLGRTLPPHIRGDRA